MNEAGKGDKQRPTDYSSYSFNYDNIFRKKPSTEILDWKTCENCGKPLLVNTNDSYSEIHTCTTKESPSE